VQANPVRTRINDDGAGICGGMFGGTFDVEITMLQLWIALPDTESRAFATKELPPPVGIPVIAPVDALKLNPNGSDPVMENE
jgi:hypothetical protein